MAKIAAAWRAGNTFDREGQRLLLRSVVIGLAVWLPVYALRRAVHWIFDANLEWIDRLGYGFLIFVPLMAAAIVVAFITRYRGYIIHYRDARGHIHELLDVEGDGLERAISLYHASDPSFERAMVGREGVAARWEMPTFSLAVRKFLATLVTLGSGGSGGLEASVALIGESMSAALFKPRAYLASDRERHRLIRQLVNWWSARDADDLQTAQLGGIAAAISTLTGAPFTSAFFAAEVMYRRRPLVEKLIYSLIPALTAYFLTSLASRGHVGMFEAPTVYLPSSDWRYYGALVIMAIAIAIFSIYFVRLRRSIDRAFHHRLPNVYLRHLTGALLTGLVAMAVVFIGRYIDIGGRESLQLVLSTGDGPIEWALAGQVSLVVAAVGLLAKVAATWMTIGSGGSAGLLVPSLYIGTMTAVIVASFTQFEPMTLIVPAMAGSLVSIVNVPLAAIMLPVELFSAHYLVPALVVLVVCTLLTQDDKIYRSQRDSFQNRQIVPGTEVRRVPVPEAWLGRTLIDLDIRRRHGLTVIGVVEASDETGQEAVRLDREPGAPLTAGETLLVMGDQNRLDALESLVYALEAGVAEGLDGAARAD